jgi:hypothetical protein
VVFFGLKLDFWAVLWPGFWEVFALSLGLLILLLFLSFVSFSSSLVHSPVSVQHRLLTSSFSVFEDVKKTQQRHSPPHPPESVPYHSS